MELTSKLLNSNCPYATPGELVWLKNWAIHHAKYNPSIVIIGAGPGVMPLALLETDVKFNLFVVEIDTFKWLDAHLKAAGFEGDTRLLKTLGDSALVGRGWKMDIDLLVVDGDHSYEGVKRDIEAWLPHVVPGGTVMFHDYGGNLQKEPTGVAQAIKDSPVDWDVYSVEIGISLILRTKYR